MVQLHEIWTEFRKIEENQNKVLEELLCFKSVMNIFGVMLLFELRLKKFIIFDFWTLKKRSSKNESY